MRTCYLVLLGLLVGCGENLSVGTNSAAESDDENSQDGPLDAHVHFQRGFSRSASGSGNLIDHSGPVLAASKSYAIWWGSSSAFPSDARTGIDALLTGLNGTSFLGITTQYMRGSASTSGFVANFTDGSSPPSRSPATSTIVNEACKEINANQRLADPEAVYFVFTSNFPRRVNFCAWHSFGSCNGKTIQVAYMPNTTGIAGCDPGNLFNCNSHSQGTRSLANVTSHEFMEAITDPDLSAWYDSSGAEIGDKCAWTFSSCVNLTNGSWQLQQEWSNSVSGCVQQ